MGYLLGYILFISIVIASVVLCNNTEKYKAVKKQEHRIARLERRSLELERDVTLTRYCVKSLGADKKEA